MHFVRNHLLVAFAILSVPFVADAATFETAKISRAINDVKLSRNSSVAQPVKEGQTFGASSTLLTGRDSRAELTFPDKTVTRIGANSVFRFKSGSRDMELVQGSFLLNVPKNAGGAKIRTATVTASITGTTIMMEYSPGKWMKFIVLEGVAKLILGDGSTTDVTPGHMIAMRTDAKKFPKPVMIKIDKLVKTSILTNKDIFAPLDGPALELIDNTIAEQVNERRVGDLLPNGVLVDGPDDPQGGSGEGSASSTRVQVIGVPPTPTRYEE